MKVIKIALNYTEMFFIFGYLIIYFFLTIINSKMWYKFSVWYSSNYFIGEFDSFRFKDAVRMLQLFNWELQ